MAAWIITHSYIDDAHWGTAVIVDDLAGPSRATDEAIARLRKGGGFAFKLYDDDGELYYRGRCEARSHSPLYDYGMPAAGCTEVRYRNDDGTWAAL